MSSETNNISKEADKVKNSAPTLNEKGWGGNNVGLPGLILITIYFLLIASVLMYSILIFWPVAADPAGNARFVEVLFFGEIISVSTEVQLLILVLLTGALGSVIHTARSFIWYTGNRVIVWSWVALYVLQPIIGAALGLLFYFVIRGGFFAPGAGVQDISPFGFIAVAGLVGMFAEPAVLKLKDVVETLFAKPPPGADSKPQKSNTDGRDNAAATSDANEKKGENDSSGKG